MCGAGCSYQDYYLLARTLRKVGWLARGEGTVAETDMEALNVFGERSEQSYELITKALKNPDGWQAHFAGIYRLQHRNWLPADGT
ncbi:MAG: hypothetical protein R3C11_05045 [Planctomycetaceae bacterium]